MQTKPLDSRKSCCEYEHRTQAYPPVVVKESEMGVAKLGLDLQPCSVPTTTRSAIYCSVAIADIVQDRTLQAVALIISASHDADFVPSLREIYHEICQNESLLVKTQCSFLLSITTVL